MEILEFRIFLEKICRRIPIKKLRNRIYREFCEHMEDMLDDFLEEGEEKDAAIQKVIKEMGDPVKINKNLRRAHRKKIILVRSINTLASILIIILVEALPFWGSVVSRYYYSSTKENLETAMIQYEDNYKYCGEIERNGRVYILYARNTSDRNDVKYYESLRLFGKIDIHDKFSGVGEGSGDGNILITLGFPDNKSEIETEVYFSFEPIKAKYFRLGFIKRSDCTNDDKPNNITSDFIAVPNIGEFVIIDAPEGYRFSGFYYTYDENKQIIENTDTDNFSIGEHSRFRSRDLLGNGGYEHS